MDSLYSTPMWYLYLYLPALFSLQKFTFASGTFILCSTIKMFGNTCSQLGKVITTWQDGSLLMGGLCTAVVVHGCTWIRVQVLKQTAAYTSACTSHVSKCLAKSQKVDARSHGVKRWGIEVGFIIRTWHWLFEGLPSPLSNRTELCAPGSHGNLVPFSSAAHAALFPPSHSYYQAIPQLSYVVLV